MRECSVVDCEKPAHSKGLCNAHRMQIARRGFVGPSQKTNIWPGVKCHVDHCDREAKSKGLCRPHSNVTWRMNLHEDALVEKLADGCALCGKTAADEAKLAIDHDHACCADPVNTSCGRCLRGVLCSSCNIRVGRFEAGELKTGTTQFHEQISHYLATASIPFQPAASSCASKKRDKIAPPR